MIVCKKLVDVVVVTSLSFLHSSSLMYPDATLLTAAFSRRLHRYEVRKVTKTSSAADSALTRFPLNSISSKACSSSSTSAASRR